MNEYEKENFHRNGKDAALFDAAPEMYDALNKCFLTLYLIPTLLVKDEELFNAVLEKIVPIGKLAGQVLKKARGEE